VCEKKLIHSFSVKNITSVPSLPSYIGDRLHKSGPYNEGGGVLWVLSNPHFLSAETRKVCIEITRYITSKRNFLARNVVKICLLNLAENVTDLYVNQQSGITILCCCRASKPTLLLMITILSGRQQFAAYVEQIGKVG